MVCPVSDFTIPVACTWNAVDYTCLHTNARHLPVICQALCWLQDALWISNTDPLSREMDFVKKLLKQLQKNQHRPSLSSSLGPWPLWVFLFQFSKTQCACLHLSHLTIAWLQIVEDPWQRQFVSILVLLALLPWTDVCRGGWENTLHLQLALSNAKGSNWGTDM